MVEAGLKSLKNRLGNTVADKKNSRLAAVLKGVAVLSFGEFESNHVDQLRTDIDAIVAEIDLLVGRQRAD